jgi:ParB family chromosome partitioning protein
MLVIGEASDGLVTSDSRFRHSFEAPLERIRPDPDQPRKSFAEAEIVALAATMATEGQLQPVLLRRDPEQRGRWILVAGERRWRAARHNGWSSLLAIEHAGDAEVAALLENLQRVDLSPLEEAHGLQRLLEGRRLSQAEAAALLGRSKSEISATLRLLTLPEALLRGGTDLPRNALVELARLEDGPVRDRLLRQAATGQLTVRAIRAARAGDAPAPALAATSAPDPVSAPSAGLSAALMERMTTALMQRHESSQPLTTAERRRLMALRDALEGLLQF